jgi:hypothetical protein
VTRRRGLTLTTIATAVALVSPPAAAEKLFRMLTAKEIRAKIIGRDLTDGRHRLRLDRLRPPKPA